VTIAEMLVLAHWCARCQPEGSDGERLGIAVRDLLETPHPCGWPQMRVNGTKDRPVVFWEGVGELTPDEARGLGVALLQAADEAGS
jgi:hypothetical protein